MFRSLLDTGKLGLFLSQVSVKTERQLLVKQSMVSTVSSNFASKFRLKNIF